MQSPGNELLNVTEGDTRCHFMPRFFCHIATRILCHHTLLKNICGATFLNCHHLGAYSGTAGKVNRSWEVLLPASLLTSFRHSCHHLYLCLLLHGFFLPHPVFLFQLIYPFYSCHRSCRRLLWLQVLWKEDSSASPPRALLAVPNASLPSDTENWSLLTNSNCLPVYSNGSPLQ